MRAKLLPLSPCIHNPSGLPLPAFHAHQHKTNRGGGLSNLHSNSYMFYTPLTVQHPAFSHLQLMSSMTQGNATPRSRACMPYLTRTIRDAVVRRPTDGYTTMPVPGRVFPAGNRHTVAHGFIRLSMMLPLSPGKRYLRHSDYRQWRGPSSYHPHHRRLRYSGYRRCRVPPSYHPCHR